MSRAILRITDGVNSVDLLSGEVGFVVSRWRPVQAAFKGDGVWKDNPMADGRRLAMVRHDNIIDTWDVHLTDRNMDGVIEQAQNLDRLLMRAVSYWTTAWQPLPVYVVARGAEETNTRYALIHSYRWTELGDPTNQPFATAFGMRAMSDLTIAVEHGPWLESPPGTGVAVEVGNEYEIGAQAYQRAPTTADEVYVANFNVESNLTHIWVYDAIDGTYTNQLGVAPPYNLLPDPAEDGDMLYLGIAGATSNPFCSVIFDLSQEWAMTGTTSAQWQYYDNAAAAWVAFDAANRLDHKDHTVTLTELGVNGVHWEANIVLAYMQEVAVNLVTGFWVRLVVTTDEPQVQVPYQQHRDVYSARKAYVEITDDQALGDVAALAQVYARGLVYETAGAITGTYVNRMLIGLRSTIRGEDFSAYLNCAQTNNPTGCTVGAEDDSAFVAMLDSPVHEAVRWQGAGDLDYETRVSFTLDAALAAQYLGVFRAFVRIRPLNAAGVSFRLLVQSGSGAVTSTIGVYGTVAAGVNWGVIDFGKVKIPTTDVLGGTAGLDALTISIQTYEVAGAADIYFYDLILLPSDEWAGDFSNQNPSGGINTGTLKDNMWLLTDSIGSPRNDLRALLLNTADSSVRGVWQNVSPSPCVLEAGLDQRLWFFSMQVSVANGAVVDLGRWEIPLRVQVRRQARYIGMRGSR